MTEIGWLEVGVIPLVGGFFFIQYDDNVTELLLQKVRADVGNYVAEKITSRVIKYQHGAVTKSRIPSLSEQESPQPETSVKTRLETLKQLKDAGLITDEEYETKRRSLVDDL